MALQGFLGPLIIFNIDVRSKKLEIRKLMALQGFRKISGFQMLSNNTSNHTNTSYQLKISNLHSHFELSLSGALHKCMI